MKDKEIKDEPDQAEKEEKSPCADCQRPYCKGCPDYPAEEQDFSRRFFS